MTCGVRFAAPNTMRHQRQEWNRRFYAEVGLRIAKARKGRATQQVLAKKTGLTRTSVVNIEKGRQQVLLHTIVLISRVLHVPLGDLVPDSDSLELLLRDKSQKALDWLRSSTGMDSKGGVSDGSAKKAD